jgi:hypothetical protein
MSDSVYFEGDPETDSTRRQMERVLKGSPTRSRWPWIATALGGGGLWLLWRAGRSAARDKPSEASERASQKSDKTAPK